MENLQARNSVKEEERLCQALLKAKLDLPFVKTKNPVVWPRFSTASPKQQIIREAIGHHPVAGWSKRMPADHLWPAEDSAFLKNRVFILAY